MHSADTPSPTRLPLRVVFFTAVLAFLLASFPARNTDLWAHLAAGRELAQGDVSFVRAAASSASTGVKQNWLYDVIAYGVYSAAGGTGLVLGKALLVVALGLVMLHLSRGGTVPW